MSERMAEHFQAIGLESEKEQDQIELLVGDRWVDAHDHFRSVTIEQGFGASSMKVEHQVNAGVLGMVWMESPWQGRWRIRRGFEVVAEGEAR